MAIPKVSIIVPVYNVERFLERTFLSLINQSLKDIEIILVDDGSPDECPLMCDIYANKYSNVRVIHKKNEGLGMACNSGIEIAQGEYIAFCDSDDYVDSNMYEVMYNSAITYKADAVFTGINRVDQNGNGSIRLMNGYQNFRKLDKYNELLEFAMGMIASLPSDPIERYVAMSAKIVLYRNEIIKKYNLRFVSERILMSEDLIWNLDYIFHSNCIVTLPKNFYYYCINSESLTKKIRTDRFYFYKKLRNELNKRYINFELPLSYKERVDKMFIGYSRSYLGTICNSNLKFIEKRKIVSDICNDCVWDKIWTTYPIKRLPLLQFIILYLIKNKYYLVLYIIFILKDFASNHK